ncbi:diguanylate cyclase [Butyricicoccus faecihominis]|uniref:diguanylate cyclase domain-containing protein n=1 Tax=Butyricicoccus faecihominis TaxID=1712515 RepID=UPI0024790EC2|nr:diguanylate cyclase [Butyricicoccus faecihominis]MCQ5130210.1 diguanylate cyclase [Butyricicoccus faecihominis]
MDTQPISFSNDEQAVLDHIPGGVLQCLADDTWTMLAVNRGFIDMFGYSREELSEWFGNRFIEMIVPVDREIMQRMAGQQIKKNGKAIVNCRVRCKDGAGKWVLNSIETSRDASGGERMFCVMLDVTESRNDREKLRLSLERHRIIMDQTADIIFEWDIRADTMFYSANWMRKFGYEPMTDAISLQLPQNQHVHPEDMPQLLELMKNAREGIPYSSIEIRIQDAEERYIWCRVRITDQYDENGKPLKTVGVITDIDREKRLVDDLRRRAERDALTGLYNREETERQIKHCLERYPEDICALLMIDIDNFKQINDGQGHLFGDAVLTELAAGMKKLTRRTDTVGRIGGDEFTIFLNNLPSKEVAQDKAGKLLDMFTHLFEGEKSLTEVTCSIGAAIYPDDGTDFQSLYHSADLALYRAKSQGKNQYVLFDPRDAVPINQIGYSSIGASIDSDQRTAGLQGDLVSYVFQILYDTADMECAIQLILEIVGKRFDVSRAYIFENSSDGKYCDNTYEWCNEGIAPEKDNLQHYPYEDVTGYKDLFKDNAIFYCRDVRSLTPAQAALFEGQGICSTLQCAIRENNQFRGFVGFDECTGMRMWTKEEIGILSLISQMLTIFLEKKHVMERDRQMTLQLNTILDMQDAYIYAVDQTNYELLYLNHKTKELDASARVGMPCYRAFFSRESPCETCPLKGAKEIYNPQYDVWTSVQVSPIKWGDYCAYLLSCYDITAYKRMQKDKTAETPED